MLDATIYKVIFNNENSMNFLINHYQLISDIKNLDNYSNTLVPYLLNSDIYTNEEKYNYNLPFYLYNEGEYSNELFSLNVYLKSAYLTEKSPTITFKNMGNYLLFSTIGQYPNACAVVKGYSERTIDFDNYLQQKANVTYISTTFSTNLLENQRYPSLTSITDIGSISDAVSERIKQNITYSVSISSSTIYPGIFFYSCNDAIDESGNYMKYDIVLHINKWWIE